MVVAAELLHPGQLQNIFVDAGFLLLVIAALLLLTSSRQVHVLDSASSNRFTTTTWSLTILGLGLCGALVTQTWYRSGTAIAGGDITPPLGTAWISKVFANIAWSGNNLGAPANNQIDLPKAVVYSLIHLLGGSGAAAQRVWFTILVAGILMAAAALGRSLDLSPLATSVVAVFYFFNPITMSQVGVYDNFLTAMVLVPSLAAAVISFGRGRLRLWQLCAIFALAAPFVGYAESNPPLVGMITVTTVLTPLLIWFRFGRAAAQRAVWGVVIAGSVLVGVSAYWIVPSLATIQSVASSALSPISAWAFTETRATLANGFWLNTDWGWSFSQYYPYAADFTRFPLDLTLPLVPLVAFCGLALRKATSSPDRALEHLRGFLTIGVLAVVLLSTGTRAPGNLIFDPLYHLPFGWLLREPGRFLIVAALGYAVLGGLLVEQMKNRLPRRVVPPRNSSSRGVSVVTTPALIAALIVIVSLASSFPLWTGAIINGAHQGYPSTRVKIPEDWNSTASYLNSKSAPRGTLLVLPPDDFYQMPYTWYYGSDGFIVNLLDRNVVVPSAEGYDNVSGELLTAVRLEATELIDHRWNEAGRILTAIGTPVVLVRGDIVADFPGRSIASPKAIASDMSRDPEMTKIHRDGDLSLFELKKKYRTPLRTIATDDTSTPNLLALSVLPRSTALVSSKPQAGHLAIFQLPSKTVWKTNAKTASTELELPMGWNYSVRSLDSTSITGAKVDLSPATSAGEIEASVRVPNTLGVGRGDTFDSDSWGPVENCDNAIPVKSPQYLSASSLNHIAPGGASALELSASVDEACVSKAISWRAGAFQLSLEARTVAGGSARICVWEEPVDRCASVPSLSTSATWSDYRATVHPSFGTKKIVLYLYADPLSTGNASVEQYADVATTPPSPDVVVVGSPIRTSRSEYFVALPTGYSDQWVGPNGAKHVIVDGMRNGWITDTSAAGKFHVVNTATRNEHFDEGLVALVMALLCSGLWLAWRRYNSSEDVLKAKDGGE